MTYQRYVVPVDKDTELEANVVTFGARTVTSYTLPYAKKWSVALLLGGGYMPAKNYDVLVNGAVGIEWNLVPVLKSNDRSFSVRYIVGPEYHNYKYRNIEDKNSQWFIKHSIRAALMWHFKKIDIEAAAGATSPLTDYKYASLFGSVSLNWRVVGGLTIMPSISAGYTFKNMNEPLEIDYSNPVMTILGGGSFSKFSLQTMLTVRYVFGNALLNVRDQRWKGVEF